MNSRRFIIGMIALGLAQVVLAANPPTRPARQLLEQLRNQRQEILKSASHVPATLLRPDLGRMIGLKREAVAESLGTPDFCTPSPGGRGCNQSPHWAYFFYRYRPPSAKAVGNGQVEVTVTAGGGWAVEMNFSQDTVMQAYWRKQE